MLDFINFKNFQKTSFKGNFAPTNYNTQSSLLQNYIQGAKQNSPVLPPALNSDTFQKNTNIQTLNNNQEENRPYQNDLPQINRTGENKSKQEMFFKAAILATMLAAGAAGVKYFLKTNSASVQSNIGASGVQGNTGDNINSGLNGLENFAFSPAKTIKEAIEYGKEKLKIKNYVGFEEETAENLNVINWINEGLTNATRTHKGSLKMPDEVVYADDSQGNLIAWMMTAHNPNHELLHSTLGINKGILGKIEEKIDEMIQFCERGNLIQNPTDPKYETPMHNKMLDMISKLRNNNLSYNEKVELYNKLRGFEDNCYRFYTEPVKTLKDFLTKEGKLCGEDYLNGLRHPDLSVEREHVLSELETYIQKGEFRIETPDASPFQSIYHEMGHLQDSSIRRAPSTGFFASEAEYPPELREWLDNEHNMNLAKSISHYASTGPGEFIAEVYARLMSGHRLSDDVKNLYRQMRGPSIEGII